jgi:hypothetical protein
VIQLTYLAMFGFPLFAMALFALLPARRAVIATFLLGFLFLPEASIPLSGFPDYSKPHVIALSAMLGAILFDARALLSIQPRWIDLPMAMWILAPSISAILIDRGLYDALVSALSVQLLVWGIPYLLGRAYITDLAGARDLAVAIVLGAIIYSPLCLWEMRMSPQLHGQIYGFKPSVMVRQSSLGIPLYRPSVFLPHGLYVGVLMGAATIVAFWLWLNQSVKQLSTWLPMSLVAWGLYGMTILCQVLTGIAILHLGLAALLLTRWLRTGGFVVMLLLLPAGFMTLRLSGDLGGHGLVQFVRMIHEDRARSLEFRIRNDNLLMDHALNRPLFGWGQWGGNRVTDEWGKDVVTDGLWIILLGQYGIYGLGSLTLALMLPGLALWQRLRGDQWRLPSVGPTAALVCFANAYVIDSLVNATINPVTLLCLGAVSSVVMIYRQPAAAPQAMWRPTAPMVPMAPPRPGPGRNPTFPPPPRPAP